MSLQFICVTLEKTHRLERRRRAASNQSPLSAFVTVQALTEQAIDT